MYFYSWLSCCQAININFTENGWGGLQYNNKDSLLDGSVDSEDGWYAIGVFKILKGIPAAKNETQVVELYVSSGGEVQHDLDFP